jgi:predicted RNA-binding protein YlxR (DUF448 family)
MSGKRGKSFGSGIPNDDPDSKIVQKAPKVSYGIDAAIPLEEIDASKIVYKKDPFVPNKGQGGSSIRFFSRGIGTEHNRFSIQMNQPKEGVDNILYCRKNPIQFPDQNGSLKDPVLQVSMEEQDDMWNRFMSIEDRTMNTGLECRQVWLPENKGKTEAAIKEMLFKRALKEAKPDDNIPRHLSLGINLKHPPVVTLCKVNKRGQIVQGSEAPGSWQDIVAGCAMQMLVIKTTCGSWAGAMGYGDKYIIASVHIVVNKSLSGSAAPQRGDPQAWGAPDSDDEDIVAKSQVKKEDDAGNAKTEGFDESSLNSSSFDAGGMA